MQSLLALALLSTAFYYLGSRAKITSWLWSRYSPSVAAFMDCAACSGFWYGLVIGLTMFLVGYPLPLDLPRDQPGTSIVIGLLSLVVTPITAGLLQRGFDMNGTVIPTEEPHLDE